MEKVLLVVTIVLMFSTKLFSKSENLIYFSVYMAVVSAIAT